METWRILHPRWILDAPGAISVQGGVSQVSLESGPSGQELSALPIFSPKYDAKKFHKTITSIYADSENEIYIFTDGSIF